MKNTLFVFCFSLTIVIQLNSQTNTFPTSGNVGIGTSAPSYKLDVTGTGRFTGNLLIGDPNGARTEINTSTNHKIYAPTNKKTIDLDGNWHGGGFVGVYRADNGVKGVSIECKPADGTNYLAILKMRNDNLVQEAFKLSSTIFSGDTEATNFMHMPSSNSIIVIGQWGNYRKGEDFGLINKFKTSFENDVYVTSGNLGIGTETPDEKLSVNGNIHTKEVRVDLTGWSDFVFNKNYNLPTLQEVEEHINEKGHLENIPSTKEVEENGILLGDMNAKLLQKIEELTLYTIQQDKQLKEQEIINQKLEERFLKLEQLLTK